MFLGLATSGLGWAHVVRGHAAEGRRLVTEGLRLSRESGNRWVVSDALLFVGWFQWFVGEYAAAEPMLREGIAISRDLGDTFLLSNQLGILGTVLLTIGSLDAADAALRESVRLAREMSNCVALAWALSDVAEPRGAARRDDRRAGAGGGRVVGLVGGLAGRFRSVRGRGPFVRGSRRAAAADGLHPAVAVGAPVRRRSGRGTCGARDLGVRGGPHRGRVDEPCATSSGRIAPVGACSLRRRKRACLVRAR